MTTPRDSRLQAEHSTCAEETGEEASYGAQTIPARHAPRPSDCEGGAEQRHQGHHWLQHVLHVISGTTPVRLWLQCLPQGIRHGNNGNAPACGGNGDADTRVTGRHEEEHAGHHERCACYQRLVVRQGLHSPQPRQHNTREAI